jgi:hypothetical protein
MPTGRERELPRHPAADHTARPNDPTPVVRYQFTTPLGGDSSAITSINAQVSLAGVSQGSVTTFNTPSGLTDGETYDISLQVNASSLPTGVYLYTMTVTKNWGTGLSEISLTGTYQGSVNVVNTASDPLGAGWSVGGLHQLSQLATNGPVLITAGQQGTEAFQSAYSEGQSSIQDLALATTASAILQAQHRHNRRQRNHLGAPLRPCQQPVPAGRGREHGLYRRRYRRAGRGTLHATRRRRNIQRPHQRPFTTRS